jgi:dTDP-4-dehydrorhamnose 3,5-epimerase
VDAVISSGPLLDGVTISPLKRIGDERGAVMHMLRADSPLFKQFGEVYFSMVRPGAIKAWKRHRLMAQNLAVPVGRIKLVLFDDRPASSTRMGVLEVISGPDNYGLIHIPPLVWYGFQGLSPHDSLIANCATLPHDPAESEQIAVAASAVPYKW